MKFSGKLRVPGALASLRAIAGFSCETCGAAAIHAADAVVAVNFETGLKPAAEASAAKIVIAPEGSKEASAAFERRQDAITYANCFGKPNICLGWWWMGSQMGMVFEKSPLLAGLPHEPFLAPLHFRIVREGTPLPVAGFRQEDLVVYGEGGEKCYLYLAMRTLPAGNRHVMVSGLDILSSTPEGTALLDDILTALRSGKQTNE